ncbi:MAG: hypothetical protein M1816_004458 [Peltula sp. TS41687]|nr:MAG: hypothetical protein M1816_004458 [Peltula sp. TS41687]
MGSTVTTDPYQVLGVSKEANTAAIKSAYRKLALQTHPDKVLDESLRAVKQDEFRRIQQAYEILSDETKKQLYDDQVKFAQHKRDLYADVGRGGAGVGGERFEVRTAAPSRDFDRRYEERKARRSSEDDPIFDEFSFRNADVRRGPPRSHDDRKTAREMDEEKERLRTDRQNERDLQYERRRTRDRERDRGRDEKKSRLEPFDDFDEENVFRINIVREEHPRRRSSENTRRREGRSTAEESIQREPLRVRESSNIYDDTDRKMSKAQEYIQRSTKTSYNFEVSSSTMPIVEESTVRRSSARRSSDRDRTHRSGHSRTSRRERTRESPIEIVEPNIAYETRSRVVPSMPTSTSSPANIRMPSTPRAAPPPHRSSTMQVPRAAYPPETPSLSRASTMPVSSSSRQRDSGSSKLKTSMHVQVDSGYSSPSPEPSPPPTATRHGAGYIVIEDARPKYSTSSGRRRMVIMESDDEDDDHHHHHHHHHHHERSVSPHTRARSSEHVARPPMGRAGTTTTTTSARPSPTTHSYSYVYREPSSGRPTMTESPSYRKASGASTPTTPRAPPTLLRTGTGTSTSTTAHHHSSSSSSSSRRLYGEVSYSPHEIHYSPEIRHEHILYTDSRRSTSAGATETFYRDAAPHPSRSHFVHGPHLRRAETSI